MPLDSILKVEKLNHQISQKRKLGFDFGLIVDSYLICSKVEESRFTPDALMHLNDYESGLVVYKDDSTVQKDEYIYILVKSKGEYIYEFFEKFSEINVALLKSIFVQLERNKDTIYLLSNFEQERLDEPADIKSEQMLEQASLNLWGIHFPSSCVLKTVALEKKQLLAIKSLRQKDPKLKYKFISAILVFSFIAFSFLSPEEKETVNVKNQPIVPKVKHYKTLRKFYEKKSIAPYEPLISTYKQINKINLIDGWNVKAAYITRDEKTHHVIETIKLQSSWGEMDALRDLVKEGSYTIDVDADIAFISRVIATHSLYEKYARFHTGSFLKSISSYFANWFDDSEISTRDLKIESKRKNVVFKEAKISLPNLFPTDLVSIAGYLRGEPFSLEELIFEESTDKSYKLSLTLVTAGVTNAD